MTGGFLSQRTMILTRTTSFPVAVLLHSRRQVSKTPVLREKQTAAVQRFICGSELGGHFPGYRRFRHTGYPSSAAASFAELRVPSPSVSVASRFVSDAGLKSALSSCPGSCVIGRCETPPPLLITPEPAHRHIFADGAESCLLDPPCCEVALHGRRQQHEDIWTEHQPAQRCGAFLRHRSACGAGKCARRRGVCHQRWLAASRG